MSIESYQTLSARANSLVENLRRKMEAQEEEIKLLTSELSERTDQLERLQAAVFQLIENDAPVKTLIGHAALKAYRNGSL